MARGLQIVFDCAHPDRLSEFWAGALDYILQPSPEGFASWEDMLRTMNIPESDWNNASAIVDPEGNGPRIFFQKVPEGKTAKNRVHLDIDAGGRGKPAEEHRKLVDEDVARVHELGARTVRADTNDFGEYWVVMQDPEGNEFCVH